MPDTIEREAKLGAWPGFEVPDLTGAVEGLATHPVAQRQLDAVYYDTTDLRLIRAGITLRHRTRGAGDAGQWTVKFPDHGAVAEGVLARREIDMDGPAGTVPDAVAGLVAAHTRAAELVAVAHLQTARRSLELRGPDGTTWGEVDDDEVTVLAGKRVSARFREVEAEVGAAAPEKLLDRLVARLRDAGAGAPDPTPKLVRALGPRALAPPDLVPVELGDDPTLGDVVRAGITAAVLRVVEHHHVVRLDDDPEGVHQARVGTRRLRSDLRTFAPMLDTGWLEPLREELGWIADELGAVRDLDVLRARLERQVSSIPKDDRPAGEPQLGRLDEQRAGALDRLHGALASKRYAELLDRLVDAATAPRMRRSDARRAAARALPKLVRRPWRKLRRAVRDLGSVPSDEGLHQVRIRAKRARYAADVAVPVVGDPARDYAKALAGLQDVLGEHQDAVVAEDWLRESIEQDARGPIGLAAGELVSVQRAEAAALREAWPKAWRAASAQKLRKWLS